MKVKTLDGIEYEWKISGKTSDRSTSNLHQIAKSLLRKKYPNVPFYEEIPIKIESRKKLFLDFYIPNFTLAIEVNGEQHYTHSALFHKTKMDFLKAICNDTKKRMWCEINNIDLIVLKFDEVDKWDKQI